MKRRMFLLGAGALALGGGWWARPRDNGAPYAPYFNALNTELKTNGPMRPSLVIDLDRLDHNIAQVSQSIAKVKDRQFRVVEKSLPSPQLLAYIQAKAGTNRLMSFHQPFLNHDAVMFPNADILMGKPMPTRAAQLFYQAHQGPFNPSVQLQWLLDTPARLNQYLELAKGQNTLMRVNIELDVGLHRGGVADVTALSTMLTLIEQNPQHLQFSGFMGYDPFVGMAPAVLGTPAELLKNVMARYSAFTELTQRQHAALWKPELLTLNTAGSPSYQVHEQESLSNEISVGTGLLKPSHYDLPTLANHQPAVFIATPVLKATGPIQIPILDDKSRIFSWWDVNQQQTYFIYGGNWMAEYESPSGLQFNSNFGHSSNQEVVTGSMATALKVDDQVFFRPTVTEALLLEFGDLLAVRGGKIIERWPVFSG